MGELRLDKLRLDQSKFSLTGDLTFPAGEITALIGASGSGKSTLLSAIAGFLRPVAGRLLVDGTDITAQAPGTRPLSILFQDQNLFPHLSVARNVGLGLRPDLRLSSAEIDRRDAALERVGLKGLGDRLPKELSGGQQSRAALARALLRGRPWLLLDEPFSALGPALRTEMLDLVASTAQQEGLSVLMVTHDPGDAKRIAGWSALVADGVCQPPQPTKRLFADPPPALRAYIGI